MKQLILYTALLVCASNAFAGNEMGNGADNFAGDSGAAWFLGEDKPVHFCIEMDQAFNRPLVKVRAEITSTWSKWLQYTSSKGLWVGKDPIHYGFPKQLIEQTCDGREDLRFMLGTEDAQIQQEKTKYERPSAISFRQSFDSKSGWGKGWIWFSMPSIVDPSQNFPNWSDDAVFDSILLHEIGHVFGNPHVSGTIMDHALSQKLENHEIKQEWIGKIDHTKALLSTGLSPSYATGYLGGSSFFNPYRAFEWLMGRSAKGAIRAGYRQISQLGDAELEIGDDQSSEVFHLKINPGLNNPSYSSDLPVFKRMRDGETLEVMPRGGVNFGVLKHPRLNNVTALFETNMSPMDAIGPFRIKVLIDGMPQPLFAGFPEL